MSPKMDLLTNALTKELRAILEDAAKVKLPNSPEVFGVTSMLTVYQIINRLSKDLVHEVLDTFNESFKNYPRSTVTLVSHVLSSMHDISIDYLDTEEVLFCFKAGYRYGSRETTCALYRLKPS